MVDVAVVEHASMINVTQIQKMPENKSEAMKEEMNEIKAMIASVRTQCDGADKKFTDYDRFFPEIKKDVDKLNIEVYQRATKDD